jgi:hypothetical protein
VKVRSSDNCDVLLVNCGGLRRAWWRIWRSFHAHSTLIAHKLMGLGKLTCVGDISCIIESS